MENIFAQRLRKILEEKNMRQSELAKRTGIRRGTISSYIKGRWQAKPENIRKISQALNVPVEYFMNENENGLTADEVKLVYWYRNLTAENQKKVQKIIMIL